VVTAETPTIQTDTSSLGEVVSTQQMTQLPLNGRDYIQLATLTTGVVRTSSGTNGNTGGSSTGGLNSFVANGTRGTLNNFLLDGLDNNSNDNGGVVLRTNVDAIQEFKLQTNSYSAEFGRSGGAVVNAITKSGSNRYHGNIFEFFRNSALDARDYFEDPTQKKASFKQNQFGGILGGPIVKDKLFWFGDYQGTIIRNPLTWVSTVPTLAERTGDFSDPSEPTIYDPTTGLPFLGNKIPAPRIDAAAQAFMNLYPQPNQPGSGSNFIISPIEQDRIETARPPRRLRLLEVAARADLAGPLAARGRILDDGQPCGAGTRQRELAELLQEVPDKVHAGALRRTDQRDRVTEFMRQRKRVDLAMAFLEQVRHIKEHKRRKAERENGSRQHELAVQVHAVQHEQHGVWRGHARHVALQHVDRHARVLGVGRERVDARQVN